MAKPPAKKMPTAAAGAKRPAAPSGRPAGLFTWATIGVVLLAVVVIVVVKISGGSSNTPPPGGFVPTPAAIVNDLENIPAATFNTVGVTSSAISVNGPLRTKNQPLLKWADKNGVKRPTVFYYGSEYCPYCAAQRWSTIIALSRFGTFSGLGNIASASKDVFPNTPSFTFYKATYTSKYLNFVSIENLSNIPSATTGYTVLQTPNAAESALITKYDNSTYFPGAGNGSIPFISFGNQFLTAGASYSPSVFKGVTRDQVAGVLSDATNPLTQGILVSANLQTAAICKMLGDTPTAVCSSPGVTAASALINR